MAAAESKHVDTPTLRIAFEEWNPAAGRTIVLMHGWPDSPRCWYSVAPLLAAQGFRVLAPCLRGFGGTRFLSAQTPRAGQLAALGRDLIEFVDALHLQSPALVGHDWGARAVANACGLAPGIASHLVMLSVGYGTNDPNQALSLQHARNYWYHWYMATLRGERTVREDRLNFTRMMWDNWAPRGWYDEVEFLETAKAFDNPDWADVVLHSYRHRWNHVPGFADYAADDAALNPAPTLALPTLVLHGGADPCNPPASSAGKEAFFSGRYERIVIEGVGHFPQREASQRVAGELLRFVSS
jgi:pimeloyl-ACP methyl ester carboxylesterase